MVAAAEELHVLPHEPTGGWVLGDATASPAPAWFGTVGEAERAAQTRAIAAGARCIIVHDRYHRVHDVAVRRPA